MILTVYTKSACPFCDQAKSLLQNKGVKYVAINIEEHAKARDYLIEQGLRSVPQIFNGTTLIQGGYQGLASQSEEFWTQLKG